MAYRPYSNLVLNPPKGDHAKAKLDAYRKHWRGIAHVRDELSAAYIHDGLKLSTLADEAEISFGTVRPLLRIRQRPWQADLQLLPWADGDDDLWHRWGARIGNDVQEGEA